MVLFKSLVSCQQCISFVVMWHFFFQYILATSKTWRIVYKSRVEKNQLFLGQCIGFSSFNARTWILQIKQWFYSSTRQSTPPLMDIGPCPIISTYLQQNQIKMNFARPHMMDFYLFLAMRNQLYKPSGASLDTNINYVSF